MFENLLKFLKEIWHGCKKRIQENDGIELARIPLSSQTPIIIETTELGQDAVSEIIPLPLTDADKTAKPQNEDGFSWSKFITWLREQLGIVKGQPIDKKKLLVNGMAAIAIVIGVATALVAGIVAAIATCSVVPVVIVLISLALGTFGCFSAHAMVSTFSQMPAVISEVSSNLCSGIPHVFSKLASACSKMCSGVSGVFASFKSIFSKSAKGKDSERNSSKADAQNSKVDVQAVSPAMKCGRDEQQKASLPHPHPSPVSCSLSQSRDGFFSSPKQAPATKDFSHTHSEPEAIELTTFKCTP